MDENLRDVLLVVAGGVFSLLGSVVGLSIQYRLQRRSDRIEREQQKNKNLLSFLHNILRMNTLLRDYYISTHTPFPISRSAMVDSIARVYLKIQESGLDGLPTDLISNNKAIVNKLDTIADNWTLTSIHIQGLLNGDSFKDTANVIEKFNAIIEETKQVTKEIEKLLAI